MTTMETVTMRIDGEDRVLDLTEVVRRGDRFGDVTLGDVYDVWQNADARCDWEVRGQAYDALAGHTAAMDQVVGGIWLERSRAQSRRHDAVERLEAVYLAVQRARAGVAGVDLDAAMATLSAAYRDARELGVTTDEAIAAMNRAADRR